MNEDAAIQAELEHFQRDAMHYHSHYEELLAGHPGEWVAVFDQAVVGTGPELKALIARLREQGIAPERTYVGHPSFEQETWIFPL